MQSHAQTTKAPHDYGHSSRLAHHFDTPVQQFDSGKLGMWLFLTTEVLLFSGLFCAYAVYRANHPEIFLYAHQYLDKFWGGINTLVLICSSLTMAWGVRCAQLNQKKGLIICLVLTLLGGAVFMGIKYVEYKAKWEKHLLPGKHYNPHAKSSGTHADTHGDKAAAAIAGASAADPLEPAFAEYSTIKLAPTTGGAIQIDSGEHSHEWHGPSPKNVQIFFSIYFLLTGLHGIHVLAGMGCIGWVLWRATKNDYSSEYYTPVDLVGLYWHLVDLIWIYLFPLLYLIH